MSGFKVASIRGVPITLNPTAIFLALMAAWAWAEPARHLGAAVVTVIAAGAVVLVFVSILLHELGHVFCARAFGIHTSEVTLWGLGGMAKLERPAPTPRAEATISAAGPLVSIAIGLLGVLVWQAAPAPAEVLAWMALNLGYWNLFIGAFNLLPGPPLDGGGIVRGIAWGITGDRRVAGRVAGYLGLVSAAGAVVLAVSNVMGQEFDFVLMFAAILLVLGSWPQVRESQPQRSPELSRNQQALLAIMGQARELAAGLGADVVGSEHVLLALVEEDRPPLSIVFARYGVTVDALRSQLPVARPAPAGDAPPFSVGARALLQRGNGLGTGRVGLFLALSPDSQAAHVLARLGADLRAMQEDVRPAASA